MSSISKIHQPFNIIFNILDFLVFSNIFISVCSLTMVLFTLMFFSLSLNSALLVFVFSGTLASYSFHWFLPSAHLPCSRREIWSIRHRPLLFIFFAVGTLFSLFAFIQLKEFFIYLFPLFFFTFLYIAPKIPKKPFIFLRKYILAKTIYLAIVWVLVTVIIPLVISQTAWSAVYTYFTLSKFFFIFSICILFDLRDKEADSALGIKSIITLLSLRKISAIFYISICAAFCFSILLFTGGYSALRTVILIIPAILTSFSFEISRRNGSDLLFYFYLDGLMMLSGILLILLSFFHYQ